MNPFDKVTLELTRKITSLEEENAALKEQVGIDVITHGRLGYEIESLKGQVENLSALWEIAHAERSEAMLELTTLQSKSAALVDTLTQVREQCLFADDDGQIGVSSEAQIDSRLFDEICAALAAFKGEK